MRRKFVRDSDGKENIFSCENILLVNAVNDVNSSTEYFQFKIFSNSTIVLVRMAAIAARNKMKNPRLYLSCINMYGNFIYIHATHTTIYSFFLSFKIKRLK